MSGQRFVARERFVWPNGAIGWRPGGPFDCLGPWAKVQHCPIDGTDLRRTCYATGYADSFFSIPARCQIYGKTVRGFFTDRDGNPVFVALNGQLPPDLETERAWREGYLDGQAAATHHYYAPYDGGQWPDRIAREGYIDGFFHGLIGRYVNAAVS